MAKLLQLEFQIYPDLSLILAAVGERLGWRGRLLSGDHRP